MIEEAVGDAAVRAQEAGFDAIELQVVGGSLFCRFINPITNIRSDQYGGTLENRTRFLLEAITNIQKKVGHHFPLICRIPALDMVPWGLTLDNWKAIACIIEKAGAHDEKCPAVVGNAARWVAEILIEENDKMEDDDETFRDISLFSGHFSIRKHSYGDRSIFRGRSGTIQGRRECP
jgi:2,4-dienoyl-CoA reductase-like NADH-dependent reductase (Old Yellow Enzyme family)